MESCNQCDQQGTQVANSPLQAYFSTLLGNRTVRKTELIQDNSAGASRQPYRADILSRRGSCDCYISPEPGSRCSSASATNDSVLAVGENRWGLETLDASSEHSTGRMDASGVGSSSSGSDRVRLSLDKPKRPPRRRSSPIIILDEADMEQLLSHDNC